MKKNIIIFLSLVFLFTACEESRPEAENTPSQDQEVNEETETHSETHQEVEIDQELNLPDREYTFDPEYSNRALVSSDNIIWLYADMARDHRVFGYAVPSTESNKMFLLSVFTDDVEGNPFGCKYGSYYESYGMDSKGISLEYISDTLEYSKIAILKNQLFTDYAYIPSEWLEFETP